jgi:hypothetical protein
MNALNEWAFRFNMIFPYHDLDKCKKIAEKLIGDEISLWGEGRSLDVGGGFKSPVVDGSETKIVFSFGLCSIGAKQLIEKETAGELMDFIRHFASTHDARVEGEYRPYLPEEGGLIPELPEDDED